MSTIVKAGSTVSVPDSLIDQLQHMAKHVAGANQAAPRIPPAPAPRPTPGPGLSKE